MISLSVNVLYSVLSILKVVKEKKYDDYDQLCNLSLSSSISAENILSLCRTCCWISIGEDKRVVLSSNIYILLDSFSYGDLTPTVVRTLIYDYAFYCKPTWLSLISRGRREAYVYMPDDVKICFDIAGVMEDVPGEQVVAWWDQLANLSRSQQDQQKNDIGRLGERLTLKYEFYRTNKQPKWTAIESNLSGYDILSQVDANNTEKILIEVKTSQRDMENATFFVSKNEWGFARTAKHYFFYLWLIKGNNKQLAIVPVGLVEKHIPINNNEGAWQSVEIKYSAFSELFHIIENKNKMR